MSPMRTLACLLALAATACAPEVPSEPTYLEHVQPLLQANCGHCHGPDPYEPSIDYFRLDRMVRNDGFTLDAFDMREDIIEQAVEHDEPAMPLTHSLTARQMELLERWDDAEAPKGTRTNALPQASVVSLTPAQGTTVDRTLAVTLRSWDTDGDGLLVSVGLRPVGTVSGTVLASGLGNGQRVAYLNTTALTAGDYELYAIVDDGFSDNRADNQHVVPLGGPVHVQH
jgi:hypothetical protein